MKLTLLTLIFTISVGSAWGQIAQSHPEYCGLPENANPPLPDITASVDPNGRSVLYVGHGSTAIALTLPDYYMSEISQVCPLPDERMVVFAQMPPNVTVLYVVAHASIVDSLWVYHPVISPNQRWIAFTKWYPYYVQGSGEIMLYDFSKTPAQNQPPADSVHPNDPKIDAGTIIFPPGHENFAGSNIVDTPSDQIIHDVGTLHWALDSRAIVFKDVVDKDAGIAVVKLDERGNPSVFRRALTRADICGRGTPTTNASAWALNEAEFGSNGAIRLTVRSLSSDPTRVGSQDERCTEQVLELGQADFQPMAPEIHVKPTYPAPTEEDLRLNRLPRKDRKVQNQ